jgi:hypothetical protein
MNTTRLIQLRRHAPKAAALAFAALVSQAHAAIELTSGQLSYQQNFDSLPNQNGSDPAWSNDSTLPGWSIFVGPSLEQSVSQLRVSTSSGSDRAYISYGLNGDSDRALGSQGGSSHRYNDSEAPATGEMFGAMAVSFLNGTQASLSGFSFDYTGEQWHVSSNANTAHSLTVQYALGDVGTAFNQLSWLDFSADQQNASGVHFFTPTLSGGTNGNGNLAANRVTGLGASVTGLDWQAGQALWLRWVDINDPASDHGMAIDNFSLSVTPVPEPETYGMLLAGLGLVGLMQRRRLRRGAAVA